MNMIEEAYCSEKVAKLLRDKGFDWNCYTRKYYPDCPYDAEDPNGIYAPTQTTAMRWLREVHNLVIGINVYNENNKGNTDYTNPDRWWYFLEFTDTRGVYREELQPDALSNEYETYEDAVDAALEYILKNLI